MVDLTVITPVKDGFNKEWLEERNNSLLQNKTSMEVVYIGSPDTLAALREMHTPFPVQEVEHTGRNVAEKRNAGLAVARGRYAGGLDDDDVWLPGTIDRLVAALDNDKGFVGAWTNCAAFTEDMQTLLYRREVDRTRWTLFGLRAHRQKMRERCPSMFPVGEYPMHPSAGIYRTDVLRKAGGWWEHNGGRWCEDNPPIALAAQQGDLYLEEEVGFHYRRHPDSLASSRNVLEPMEWLDGVLNVAEAGDLPTPRLDPVPDVAAITPVYDGNNPDWVLARNAMLARNEARIEIIYVGAPSDYLWVQEVNTFGLPWKFVTCDSKNVAEKRNAALRHTEAPWVMSADADDLPKPGMVDLLLREATGTITAVFGTSEEFDQDGTIKGYTGEVTKTWTLGELAAYRNDTRRPGTIIGHLPMHRANGLYSSYALRKHGGWFEPGGGRFHEDMPPVLACAVEGNVRTLAEPTFGYRLNPAGLSRERNFADRAHVLMEEELVRLETYRKPRKYKPGSPVLSIVVPTDDMEALESMLDDIRANLRTIAVVVVPTTSHATVTAAEELTHNIPVLPVYGDTIGQAMEIACKRAFTPYVMTATTGMHFLPGGLDVVVDYLERHPTVAAGTGFSYYVEGDFTNFPSVYEKVTHNQKDLPSPCTLVHRTDTLREGWASGHVTNYALNEGVYVSPMTTHYTTEQDR